MNIDGHCFCERTPFFEKSWFCKRCLTNDGQTTWNVQRNENYCFLKANEKNNKNKGLKIVRIISIVHE